MRVVVVGASGNVGTSVLRTLADEARVESVLGIARRRPRLAPPKVEWAQADIAVDDLAPHFRGADCVVHLAWLIQPSRDLAKLWTVNVEGSTRLFRAAAEAGVPALVYASSVGAYSAGPKDRLVDESWPTGGIPTSEYSRAKAEVERRLNRFESENRSVRVVRLRPALVFMREAAASIRRLFLGPLAPTKLLAPERLPFVPDVPGLRIQAVHSHDVGEAFRLAIVGTARGAFNIAAEPVLDPDVLAEALHARKLRIPPRLVRGLADWSWRLHLQPSPVGWVDLALGVPLMDTTRARTELGWTPRESAVEALRELLAGMSSGAGVATPPLDPATSGRLRAHELAGGMGSRELL